MKTVACFDYVLDADGKHSWRHMLDRDDRGYIVSWWVKRFAGYVLLCELPPTSLDQAVRVFLDHYKSKSPITSDDGLSIYIRDDTVLEAVKRLAPVVLARRACQSFD